MKTRLMNLLLCLALILCALPACAEVGAYRGEDYDYFGGLEQEAPSGLGVKTYDSGAISVGVFDPVRGCEYGFAVMVDPEGGTFECHLSAGFQTCELPMAQYADADGHRIRYTASDARGVDERAFGTKTYDDGSVYCGEMKDGVPSGYGLYAFSDGRYAGGLTVDGSLNGWGVFVRADGTGYIGTFADSRLDGYAYSFDERGDAHLCFYMNNELAEVISERAPLTHDQLALSPEGLVLSVDSESYNYCGGYGFILCPRCHGAGSRWGVDRVNGTSGMVWQDCWNCTMGGTRTCPVCFGDGEKWFTAGLGNDLDDAPKPDGIILPDREAR
jgi:hypothetical protein